ncbi:MAG: hypothetical protein WBQ16_14320 [Nitrososphaeraceae archaeon]
MDRNELTIKLKMNGQMLESESKIKNEIIQQKAVREPILLSSSPSLNLSNARRACVLLAYFNYIHFIPSLFH